MPEPQVFKGIPILPRITRVETYKFSCAISSQAIDSSEYQINISFPKKAKSIRVAVELCSLDLSKFLFFLINSALHSLKLITQANILRSPHERVCLPKSKSKSKFK